MPQTKKKNIFHQNNNQSPKKEANMDKTDTNFTKRLVIVTGEKGGVGKSTLSRALFQLYINNNVPCQAFECDTRNPQLHRHFKNSYDNNIDFANFFTKGDADILMNHIDKKDVPVFLVDLPAQSGMFFEKFVKDFDFFNTVKNEIGCEVTLLSVISRNLDSINLLKVLYNTCGDIPNYIVVKNLFFGETADKFERYDNSPFRSKMLSKGLKEVCLPDLFYKTYDFIDINSLTFENVKIHPQTDIVLKTRTKTWLNEMSNQLAPVKSLLGLDNSPNLEYYPSVDIDALKQQWKSDELKQHEEEKEQKQKRKKQKEQEQNEQKQQENSSENEMLREV